MACMTKFVDGKNICTKHIKPITLRLLLIAATKFSGLARNLFQRILILAIAIPLYIFFIQEIVIAHTKFSDFDPPAKIAKFSSLLATNKQFNCKLTEKIDGKQIMK